MGAKSLGFWGIKQHLERKTDVTKYMLYLHLGLY